MAPAGLIPLFDIALAVNDTIGGGEAPRERLIDGHIERR